VFVTTSVSVFVLVEREHALGQAWSRRRRHARIAGPALLKAQPDRDQSVVTCAVRARRRIVEREKHCPDVHGHPRWR
jgi:hypothetical protein